jgi:hypothetical protein
MISVLDLGAVDYGFVSRSRQIKDYKIGMCCFFAKHAALRRKSKNCLARNQDMCRVEQHVYSRVLFQ